MLIIVVRQLLSLPLWAFLKKNSKTTVYFGFILYSLDIIMNYTAVVCFVCDKNLYDCCNIEGSWVNYYQKTINPFKLKDNFWDYIMLK